MRATPDRAVPAVSVVVPCYRSAATLSTLVEGLHAALASEASYEIVLVNDSSPDDTWAAISRLAAADERVRGIDLLVNHGQQAATMCGLAHAGGEVVVTMDDDLQQPPDEVRTLLDALRADPDLDAVIGTWPRDEGLIRNLGSVFNGWVDRLANGTPRGLHHTAFRAMQRPVVDTVVANGTRTPILWALVGRSAGRLRNVAVRHDARPEGRSGFTLREGSRLVLATLFLGTTLPLRLLSLLGAASAFLSLVAALVFTARWATGVATPPGWVSSFLAVMFFGGATLLGVGLIGEYLGLVMREVREPPRWAIRRTTSTAAE
ncbi:glycosyltransferase [Nitriliruptor alkaliphilus]|uniref:glycosyltransferase n=1 Tax=Nitriliruptor alkaliphilus TaxID=427918 RepID=UPI0006979E45|nr:glycosyltransferase [Nitriliruptor alkaliphilus]